MNSIDANDIQGKIDVLAKQLRDIRRELVAMKHRLPREEAPDYELTVRDGLKMKLSEFFGASDELIVIHNMGKGCAYCTLWADGFNGVLRHFENRAGFVVVSPDDWQTQRDFADSRGWKFRMASGKGSSFTRDLGFETPDGKCMPGFSTFEKGKDGKMYRTASDEFGPGDYYCGIWHMFDLLPKGANRWAPKFKY